MKRNREGLVLKVLGGRDHRPTVLDHAVINGHYQRIRVNGGDLPATCDPAPTM